MVYKFQIKKLRNANPKTVIFVFLAVSRMSFSATNKGTKAIKIKIGRPLVGQLKANNIPDRRAKNKFLIKQTFSVGSNIAHFVSLQNLLTIKNPELVGILVFVIFAFLKAEFQK